MKNYRKFGDCPLCKAECKSDEDVVVCPECGAPYHRECYNSVGQCVYKEKHSQGFSYAALDDKNGAEKQKNNSELNAETPKKEHKKCPRCFNESPIDAPFCQKCGYPFSENNEHSETTFNGIPIPPPFDPLFGLNKDETINDIKISEFAQYIKGNLLYYIPIFKNISEKNKSKFNFSAFLFSGAWFLYRKLYKIGIALTSAVFLLSILSTFIEFTYANDILVSLFRSIGISASTDLTLDKYDLLLTQFYALPLAQKFIVFLPAIIQIINFVIMLISGFVANKIYYKNCCSKIKKIKVICKDNKKLYDEEINKFGGVNFKIIPFILICYMIIEYLPRFLI